VVLHSAMPGRTGRVVPLARELGATIQDACIVTSDEATPGGVGVPPANNEGKDA